MVANKNFNSCNDHRDGVMSPADGLRRSLVFVSPLNART
jgi:hypothetical protein